MFLFNVFTSSSKFDHWGKKKDILTKPGDSAFILDAKKYNFEAKAIKYIRYTIDIEHGIYLDREKLRALGNTKDSQYCSLLLGALKKKLAKSIYFIRGIELALVSC